ncbi:MAG TPA: hypothetical protein VL866_07480 [Pyrinomonadaceae bacterium]|nr:hypothetical protein [Pyrinomonadaceae bacterium]
MTDVKTTQGRTVSHCHVPNAPCTRELNEAEIAEAREIAAEINQYANEISPPTAEFNCHGFAVADSHGWFNHPRRIFEDDFDRMPLESARRNDIVVYMNGDTVMHSARITQMEDGQIHRLRSKWGNLAVLSHSLKGVPEVYGSPAHILRRREVD